MGHLLWECGRQPARAGPRPALFTAGISGTQHSLEDSRCPGKLELNFLNDMAKMTVFTCEFTVSLFS